MVKHRMKFNWIKMYDMGTVLRIETVINNQGRIPGAAFEYAAGALMSWHGFPYERA